MAYYQLVLRRKGSSTEKRILCVEAATADLAREKGGRGDWDVTVCKQLSARPSGRVIKVRSKIVRGEPLVRLCRGLAAMLEAGITLEEALFYYSDGLEDKALARWLQDARARMLSKGVKAADAFASTGHFDEVFIGLVEAGGESASMPQALEAIADRTEMLSRFRTSFLTATGIPTAVMLVANVIFIAAMCNVIPQIESLVLGFNAKPDGFSALVFNTSHIVKGIWPVYVAALIGLVGVFSFSPAIRNTILSFFMSKIKVLRNMIMGLRQLLVLSSMALLTKNKIRPDDALITTARIMKNTPMEGELKEIHRRYTSGMALSMAFEKYGSFDKQVFHMIKIGEKSTSLEVQFERLSRMYEKTTTQAMGIFTKAAGFSTMIIALIMIGFVFSGTMLPVVLMGPKIMKAAQ